MRRIDRAFVAGKLGPRRASASVETLQRRIAYGGRKGRRAAKRVRAISRHLVTDRDVCQQVFGLLPIGGDA
jgi:hypothetical protein